MLRAKYLNGDGRFRRSAELHSASRSYAGIAGAFQACRLQIGDTAGFNPALPLPLKHMPRARFQSPLFPLFGPVSRCNFRPITFLVLCAAVLPARSDPARVPKRMINERTVDLSPLFKWWTKHEGERPLPAWAHLNGKVAGTNAYSWIIEGKADSATRLHSSEGQRFLLKNPPLQDRAQFETLRSRLKVLEAEQTRLKGEQMQAKNRAAALRAQHKNHHPSRAEAIEARQLHVVETRTASDLKAIDQNIAGVKKNLSAYPNGDHYVLDSFALETGQEQNGLRIYDYGVPMR
jgi:hypothetical protein